MKEQIAAINSQKFAQGGVVPQGYPDDSYPARLTSGEVVLPPNKLNNMGTSQVNVVIEPTLRGQDIYWIVKEVERKNKNSF
jgi:hypothetical protein